MERHVFVKLAEGYLRTALHAFPGNRWLPIPFTVDHVCFKCHTDSDYFAIRSELEREEVAYSYTSLISGRLISILKLQEPLEAFGYTVSLIELCAPKPDADDSQGYFDHIEIVPGRSGILGFFSRDAHVRRFTALCEERRYTRVIHADREDTVGEVYAEYIRVKVRPEPLLEKIRNSEFN